MFNDEAFRRDMNLSAVNSINWARVMAQIVYYVTAAVSLGAPSRAVTFAVPTGNFGDVYAGYAASRMGLPIRRLIVATNRNDILARALAAGHYRVAEVSPTMSPSMDIQVASNFERLLFDLYDGDGAAVTASMTALSEDGGFDIAPFRLERARDLFDATRIDEDATLAEIARVHAETGLLIDPHTAVGVAAARAVAHDPAVPVIALATAHPAKFPDAVERATGLRPASPPPLAGLLEAEERCQALDSDIAAVQNYIRSKGQPDA
jgi:threonine synthase